MSLIKIPISGILFEAELVVVPGAAGLVIFAHGSGSGRGSPRDKFVAGRV